MSGSEAARKKQALRGVGIGCGILVAAAVVGIGGTLWLKAKVADAVGTPEEVAAHVQQIDALDQKYPSGVPSEGEKLDTERVEAFFALRERLLPTYEQIASTLKTHEQQGRKADIRGGLETIGNVGELIRQLRDGFVEAADAQRMSPAEFTALSRIVYESYWRSRTEARVGERKVIERTIAQIDERLASNASSETERARLKEQRESLNAQLANLPLIAETPRNPDEPRPATILGANVTLLDKYRAKIERLAMPGLETFLFGERYTPPPAARAEGQDAEGQ